ncbi:uncharacterized protein A1O9_04703 [Exophiala aquamarina CBS 119918]|uniref:Cytochrome P450 oxidoreductase n=1 Tax=Exophiala aquamarina CBS 119918 TaxID=1182545 RepID=A0A072PWA7_9EURO|nr:uncharacterized protein A1O9_04703 [Exophiala aquamarina CBS 119918]KEF59855.1 hypothetical protein A1O9_04703 [Exophiala aquamarina CBS 119918]
MSSIPELFTVQNLQCVLVVVGATLSFLCVTLFQKSKRAGLSHIPGPFIARYTNLWAVYVTWKTDREDNRVSLNRTLQERYGDVIRTGPRNVSVTDPAAIPVIYGVRSRLDKGHAYVPFRQAGVTTSLLSIPDETTHSKYRKLVSNAYSLSSIKAYEPYVDEMINRLVHVCNEHAKTGTPMNLSLWCHYYCFDVVAKITMGDTLGFLEGRDAYSLIKSVKAFGAYTGVVSQMPWLHKIFQDNPLMRKTKPSPFMKVVQKTVESRLEKPDVESRSRPDLLAHFIATHQNNPEMDRLQVLITTSGNLIAGGLSPGKTFNEICYFLAANVQAQDTLLYELKEARCTHLASYEELKQLGFLEGVIKEALRLHSSTSFNLQRNTGPNRLELPNGIHIPPYTNIGCPAGAINQDVRVFGEDAHIYRPERWQQAKDESQEAYIERRKIMERTELSFGQGSRTCIGKNIALMEMFKAVATLMGQFKFEPVGTPAKDKVIVKVHRRDRA